jgi:hypothetical protein
MKGVIGGVMERDAVDELVVMRRGRSRAYHPREVGQHRSEHESRRF